MQGFMDGRSDFAGRVTAVADTGFAPAPAAANRSNTGLKPAASPLTPHADNKGAL